MLQYVWHRNTKKLQALVTPRVAVSPVAASKQTSEIPGHFARYDGLGDKDKERRVPTKEAEHSDDNRLQWHR